MFLKPPLNFLKNLLAVSIQLNSLAGVRNSNSLKMNDKEWCLKVQAEINRLQSLVRKEKSPSVKVSVQNCSAEAVIDEGAELNCLDEDFCLENGITFRKTPLSATAAGQNRMTLAGETELEILLTPVHPSNMLWNLGVCVVVKNLGNSILIGEPGKKDNKIVTVAHEKRILAKDIEGKDVTMKYYAKKSKAQSFLCRAKENTTRLISIVSKPIILWLNYFCQTFFQTSKIIIFF